MFLRKDLFSEHLANMEEKRCLLFSLQDVLGHFHYAEKQCHKGTNENSFCLYPHCSIIFSNTFCHEWLTGYCMGTAWLRVAEERGSLTSAGLNVWQMLVGIGSPPAFLACHWGHQQNTFHLNGHMIRLLVWQYLKKKNKTNYTNKKTQNRRNRETNVKKTPPPNPKKTQNNKKPHNRKIKIIPERVSSF